MTFDEFLHGTETAGMPFHGMHEEMLERVMSFMESKGQVRRFQAAEEDDKGIKFF